MPIKINLFKYFVILLVGILLTSCGSRKDLVYFQTAANDSVSTNKSFTPVFKVDDFISVTISAEDVESATPFNFPNLGMREPINFTYTTGTPVLNGYLIDETGHVDLPVIGKVHVAGKSRMEVTEELQKIYKEYLNKPVVNIQIRNFKVTVLGDVARPGTFVIPNERFTIIEALGLAGDLRMTGLRNNVLVIRDREGVKTEYRINLTSSDFLHSPVYYLEQNDVVYVEPNITARSQAAFWRSTGGLFISLTSLIVTTVVLVTN